MWYQSSYQSEWHQQNYYHYWFYSCCKEKFWSIIILFSNSLQYQFLINSENSLSKIATIQSNSENVLVAMNGLFIKLSIRKLKNSVLSPVTLACFYGTSVRRANTMTLLWDRRWFFKCQTKKNTISSNSLMIILNWHTLKVELDSSILVTLLHYTWEQQELL